MLRDTVVWPYKSNASLRFRAHLVRCIKAFASGLQILLLAQSSRQNLQPINNFSSLLIPFLHCLEIVSYRCTHDSPIFLNFYARLCTGVPCTDGVFPMVEYNENHTAAIPCSAQSTAKKQTSTAKLSGGRNSSRRIASKACQCCRLRKVRCSVMQDGIPCANCRLDDVKCVVREAGRRQKQTGNLQPCQSPGSTSVESGERQELLNDEQFEDVQGKRQLSQATFSFMGIQYFPQLEAAMRKANIQMPSEEPLAPSTLSVTGKVLPHFMEDSSPIHTGWAQLTDASPFRATASGPLSPSESSIVSTLTPEFSGPGSNPIFIETASEDPLDLLCNMNEGELMTKEEFDSLIDFNASAGSYAVENIIPVGSTRNAI
jgi:hypothetical protein